MAPRLGERLTTAAAFVPLVAAGVAPGIVLELADAVALFIAHAALRHRGEAGRDGHFSGGASQANVTLRGVFTVTACSPSRSPGTRPSARPGIPASPSDGPGDLPAPPRVLHDEVGRRCAPGPPLRDLRYTVASGDEVAAAYRRRPPGGWGPGPRPADYGCGFASVPPTDWLPCCDSARAALQARELRARPLRVLGPARLLVRTCEREVQGRRVGREGDPGLELLDGPVGFAQLEQHLSDRLARGEIGGPERHRLLGPRPGRLPVGPLDVLEGNLERGEQCPGARVEGPTPP